MPQTEVIFYCESDGTAPVKAWLEGLDRNKVLPRCKNYIDRLKYFGYNLPRPTSAHLRDGIRELRPTYRKVHYRILYFFGQGMAVLAHGCSKEGQVNEADIDRAIERKNRFLANPERHTYIEED